nr:M28 family peptidase [Candidatus Sigynarchaeota archaeon]
RLGLVCHSEVFQASDFFMKYINRVPYFLLGIYVLVVTIVAMMAGAIAINLVLAMILSILGFAIEGLIRFVKYRAMYSRFAVIKDSENIIIEKQAEHEEKIGIYFLAHSDSKSELPDPKIWMAVEYVSVFFGSVILAMHIFIYTIFSILTGGLVLHPSWIFFYGIGLAVIDMLRMSTSYFEGESPGASDDAIGVAMELELMKRIENHAFQHVRVTSVITGAEEVGEAGAYCFLKKRAKTLSPVTSHFIVIDSLTTYRFHYFTSRGFTFRPFSRLILKAMNNLLRTNHETTKPFSFHKLWMPPPVNTDHSPVVKLGFPAFVMESTVGYTHTRHDTIDRIDFQASAKTIDFLVALLDEIDTIAGTK